MSFAWGNQTNYPMVNIPSGEVQLRDDRIKKAWVVQVDAFQMAPIPVTKDLYSFMMHQAEWNTKDLKVPVTEVSWRDAVTFCNMFSRYLGFMECYTISDDSEDVVWNKESNGFRLPTEAEWQYACKAGTSGYRYGELETIAWYRENSGGGVQEVMKKEPNAWGLYDMLGNVWEWCWDIYDEDVYGSYRVFRGGSWAEESRGCGASCRRRSHPTFRIDDLGFRLARSV
ncbi:UNVERIFIED_CONTAM: formylglycine-generating enzyme required for sulfatase activity [Brevibacillus sp. OAP136]